MEALVCGNTEVAPHDLLIRINKLARIDKKSKQTGYAQEFKVETNSLHDVFSHLYNQFLPVTILLPFNSNQTGWGDGGVGGFEARANFEDS